MPSFERNEIVSATQLVRQFSTILGNLLSNKLSKIGIIRNNEMEAVILPVAEYERICALAEKAERRSVKDYFGTVNYDTTREMEMAVADCRKVDINEW